MFHKLPISAEQATKTELYQTDIKKANESYSKESKLN